MLTSWYQRTSTIILTLILIFPIGLILMWRWAVWSRLTKFMVTILVLGVAVGGTAFAISNLQDEGPQTKQVTKEPSSQQQEPAALVDPLPQNSPLKKIEATKVKDGNFVHYYLALEGAVGNQAVPKLSKAGSQHFTVDMVKAGCDGASKCNYVLWDSQEAYTAAKTRLPSSGKDIATSNKEHVLALVDEDKVFYTYGVTGSGKPGSETKLNTSSWKFSE